jgi:hypothetical protein
MLVLELVTGSLRRAGIIGEAETPSAEEGADAVLRLNDMMAAMAEDGIDFGWNPKSTTADTAVLPLGHIESVKDMLVVKLADEYGTEVSALTARSAADGYQRMLRQAINAAMREKVSDAPQGDRQRGYYNIVTDG